ncbi:Rossmann-like and DUF2520 domain-containing protein [Chromobacterium sphagni]|uniref:DUF2520 domain-containing protein n=1 Tax=Chromobacterium sphagni TaxID=1903179 RepID=A0A1S1X1K0_9NEIS|nr:Rossmann-like and DUF2520 domain-containing protein [Chromobacterium sphagni]OHX13208.1 hypothetical protein BI347_06595 [Chromobacterium sphagni]OHX20996.1 hypothetical protein BI344_00090 [Chromobacterium sphagni]
MQTLTVIGPGRLGSTLARLARQSGEFEVVDVMARRVEPLRLACDFIGAGRPVSEMRQLAPVDLYLLAVPDAAVAFCARALAAAGVVPAGSVVFHASGVGEASLLQPLAERGAHVASLHPAFSFADPARAVAGFAGTLCALEGDEAACLRLEPFVLALGGRPFRLAAGGKAAYHAALSVASNYLVALTAMAQGLTRQAGVPAELAAPLLGGLMRQTLDNALELGPRAALTGPILRGDVGTVERHLSVLADVELASAYRALGRQTVALAGERLPDEARRQLMALLY